MNVYLPRNTLFILCTKLILLPFFCHKKSMWRVRMCLTNVSFFCFEIANEMWLMWSVEDYFLACSIYITTITVIIVQKNDQELILILNNTTINRTGTDQIVCKWNRHTFGQLMKWHTSGSNYFSDVSDIIGWGPAVQRWSNTHFLLLAEHGGTLREWNTWWNCVYLLYKQQIKRSHECDTIYGQKYDLVCFE